MKKAGVLTIHRAQNYGAALQAFATNKILEDIGLDVKFIDYSVSFTIKDNKFVLAPVSASNIKHNIKSLSQPIKFFKKKKRYEEFLGKYFNMTEKTYSYKNYQDIANEDVDFLITGSDQTFALNLIGDPTEREVYFLPFKSTARKISYASSMGEKTQLLTEQQKDFMKTHLDDFDVLSVREGIAADITEGMIGKRPKKLFDPTLAISRDDWDCISKPCPVNGKYILFYSVLSDTWVVEYVKQVSKKTGLPVIALHNRNRFEANSGFHYMNECGPCEFITMIKNAEFVLTSSFHGTAFSIIYEKPFISFKLGEGNRIGDLLEAAGLEQCGFYIEQKREIRVPKAIDGIQTGQFLKTVREVNEGFLKRAIS